MPDHDNHGPGHARHASVRVDLGGTPVIRTAAWLALRTRGVHEGLTRDLHTWARRHHAGPADLAWRDLAPAWCHESTHGLTASGLVVHTASRLDGVVWVLPAATLDGRRIVIVGIDQRPPTVYADGCPDSWAWHDADSLAITCPSGHSWIWRTGRELITSTGKASTLTVVFGPDLDAPFTTCPTCTGRITQREGAPGDGKDKARDGGRGVCGCDRDPWIVCPTCGKDCTLTLPTP